MNLNELKAQAVQMGVLVSEVAEDYAEAETDAEREDILWRACAGHALHNMPDGGE